VLLVTLWSLEPFSLVLCYVWPSCNAQQLYLNCYLRGFINLKSGKLLPII
jgi:hypothetical protein